MNDAFEILGINRNADTRQIRVAYHREARTVHPDTGGDADLFIRLHKAYQAAQSFRAATKMRPSATGWPRGEDQPSFVGPSRSETRAPFESESLRYDLAEIAYRFELGRPGRSARSFMAAIDAELYPSAQTLNLPADALELISYLIGAEVDIALIVSAMVREIDNARSK